MDARWRQRDAAVRVVLAADAAEAERQRAAAEAEEKARKAAEEAKRRAEEEEKKKAEAAAKAKSDAEKAAAATAAEEKRRREEEKKAAEAAATAPGAPPRPGVVPRVQTSAEASAREGEFAAELARARTSVAEYSTSASTKRERRALNAQITVHVQQIAATKTQIEKKAIDVATMLSNVRQEPQRTFALVSLAKRILTQCDSQVRSIHWFPYDRVGVVNADP
jgi:nucleoporin GLE1